jgi:hypothetical protein
MGSKPNINIDELLTWLGNFIGVHDGGVRKCCRSTLEYVFVFTTMLPRKKIGFGDYVLNGFQRKQRWRLGNLLCIGRDLIIYKIVFLTIL